MTEASATITSKGQITIPLQIRQRLHLSQGDTVTFVVEGDHAILRPGVSVVAATAGVLRGSEPALDASELREAAEQAIADDASGR